MTRVDRLREELGGPSPGARDKVRDHMIERIQEFISKAPFAVLATSNEDGDCDASPKGGKPGFIKVIDEKNLLIPDIGGNRLFHSYQNMESNPKAALVFMIPGSELTVRVNGRVRVLVKSEIEARDLRPEVHNPDDNSGLTQGIMLSVDEAYFHCPRAFRFSKLWDQ